MIVEAVRRFFARDDVTARDVMVAASAGVDSTALLFAMTELRAEGFTVSAVHINHHLRGDESDADEHFVRDLCARLDVPLGVEDGALDPAAVRERGVEAAAREVRYARFAAVRGSALVATAHQKNDQAETVLMRLLTGGGLASMRGIHPVRHDGVIRPLLEVTRDDIETFLRERGVTPRIDRSNADPRFLRNRVRILVRELGATNNLVAFAEQARAAWPILERAIDDAERACVEARDDESRFLRWPDDPWIRGALLQRQIRRLDPDARDFDATRLAAEVEHIQRMSVTKHLELARRGGTLVLQRHSETTPEFEVQLTEDAPAYIPDLNITISVRQRATGNGQRFGRDGQRAMDSDRTLIKPNRQPATGNPQRFGRDACELTDNEQHGQRAAGSGQRITQLIQLPKNANPHFTVRNRRRGDRFHPLGLAGEKKLKDFFIDRKIAAELRDRIPLVIWNGEIVWVGGIEISERFKVTGEAGERYEVWMET